MKAKNILLKTLASSLIALNIFNGLIPSNTITAIAAEPDMTSESQDDGTFIPFRSYYVNYLSQHCTEADDEAVYIFCKMMSEQMNGTDNCSAGNWFSTYYSETVLPGGTYLSESEAKKQYIYKNGTSNATYYDQLIANLISANGMKLINAWVNGYTDSYGDVVLSASQGKDSFIKFFDSEYGSWTQTAAAITKLTQTSEGNTWMQNYVYAKNGSSENSVGITLLKLYCTDFDDINSTQLAWCKGYLPYLLSNYASNGASALAASTKNAYLYDFMARSVNGAQSTLTKASATTVSANGTALGTVAKGTSLQQEFFNYVVASGTGFGEFCQNIIGGGKYTGAYANSYNLNSYDSVGSMYYGSNNSNINYYTSTANGGDKDTDWFVHAMYLYSTGAGYGQFGTVYRLTQNNGSAKNWYDKWISRFHGKKGEEVSWNYLSNQTTNITNTLHNVNGGHSPSEKGSYTWFGWKNHESSGWLNDDPAGVTANSYTNQLIEGLNFGRASKERPAEKSQGWLDYTDATFRYYTPLNQDFAGANKVTVYLGGGSYDYETGPVTVKLVSSTGDTIASTTGVTSAVLPISESNWSKYGNIYLEIVVPHSTIVQMGESRWKKSGKGYNNSFGIAVTGVKLSWSSSQNCINGHNFGSWIYNYSDDNKTCTVKHTCSTCGVDESETFSVEKGNISITETDTSYVYKYIPKTITSLPTWTKTISKDLGIGKVTYSSISGSEIASGTWSITNDKYEVSNTHPYINGVWYSASESVSFAKATALVKKGAIKANAKTVTVTSPYFNNTINATLYNKNGAELISGNGTGSVTLNLTGLDMSQKNGCYLVITHSRTCAAVTKVANMGWYTFPVAPIVSATTTADKVTVTY